MANLKFANALGRVPQNCPPIWMMRQAGRYHGHYQKLRAQYSFMELCKDPELAARVTLGPVQDFDFDVAILFSDLLFPLEALGMGLQYTDSGPQLSWHLDRPGLKKLKPWAEAAGDLEFQKKALEIIRSSLAPEKSLIGFVGGPWTLFGYAVQGKHDGGLTLAKKNLDLFAAFCARLIPLLIKNIELQLSGGAEVVMIFDTAAGELAPDLFGTHVVPELTKLAKAFPGKLGYYSRGTQRPHLQHRVFADGAFAGLGVDHRWDLSQAFGLSPKGFVQGNFDQALLFSDRDDLKKLLTKYLQPLKMLPAAARAGWVCGLGHGVLPGTPEDNVKIFVNFVREALS